MLYRTLLIMLCGLLTYGCNRQRLQPVPERRVKVTTVLRPDFIDKDFAGMSTADNAANLAFKVGGQIERIDVSEGTAVPKGFLIARLDPKEYELQRDAARSAFQTAQSQFERAQRLLSHEAISRAEYESAQTAYIQAKSAYDNTADILRQTRLTAPFAGIIEKKFADLYQRVQAGESIVRLVDPVTRSVRFTMPESGLALLGDTTVRYFVEFDNYRGVRFPAYLKDYVRTSSDASGFPVTLGLHELLPKGRYDISPGMSCIITLQIDQNSRILQTAIPLSAVYAPISGGTFVWIVEGDSVRLREIVLGEPFGRNMTTVESGLNGGERVVTAGVYRLQEGEKVEIIK